MHFSVRDFGPIRSAKLELRGLTIVMGKNGSGKTYLTRAVRAILKHLSIRDSHKIIMGAILSHSFSEEFVTKYPEVLKKIIADTASEIESITHTSIVRKEVDLYISEEVSPKKKSVYIDGLVDMILSDLYNRQDFERIIEGTFLQQPEDLSKGDLLLGYKHGNLFLKFSNNEYKVGIEGTPLGVTDREDEYVIELLEGEVVRLSKEVFTDHYQPAYLAAFLNAMRTMIERIISVRYIPAERSALMKNYRLLALQSERSKEIPDVLNEFLETVGEDRWRNMSAGRKNVGIWGNGEVPGKNKEAPEENEEVPDKNEEVRSKNAEALESAKNLLHELIGGDVVMRSDNEFVFENKDLSIPLHSTSSMISGLAPLLIYLRYTEPGDLVIIEGPESHLYPEAHRVMAKVLARLVNSGIKVMVTTHSDFLVGQVDNLVRASRLNNPEELGMERYDLIKEEDVSVYYFDDENVLHEIPVGEDGVDHDIFADVVQDLYDESLSIDMRLKKDEL